MATKHFCTLFDSNYLLKGVVTLQTLAAQCHEAKIFVLCMDQQTYDILTRLALPKVECLTLAEVEDDALLAVKGGRSRAEYCWTLAPCLPWHLMNTRPEIDTITYVDADLMFYAPVDAIFEEIGDASISIIEHRYTKRLAHLEMQGHFNVEWVGFKRDPEGLACLSRWREQCLDWCYARIEKDRVGDQKYLDAWPSTYKSVHIIQNPGAGLAPWNFPRYRVATKDEQITVDGHPLIFYHFHQLQLLEGGRFSRLAALYLQEGKPPEVIYERYEAKLLEALEEVRRFFPDFTGGLLPWLPVAVRRTVQNLLPLWLKSAMRRFVQA